MSLDLEAARQAMITRQVRPWEVLDPRVLDTLAAVPREEFVPPRYRKLAFADLALPLEHGECMLRPIVEGRLLQALELAPGDAVLEVGTGSGFFTACLAHLARAVTSLDIHADFVERARARFAAEGRANAEFLAADVFAYTPERGFDAICLTGAVARLPEHFRDWLRPGGRLVCVEGRSPAQEALRLTRTEAGWRRESLFDTDIPYLRGGAPEARFSL